MSTERREVEAKPADHFVEMSGDPEKDGVLRENADYSGAVKKSSPEEIALVRKLDIRIMVSASQLFSGATFADTAIVAHSLVHVLSQLCEFPL